MAPLPRVPLMQGSSQKCSPALAARSVAGAPQKPGCCLRSALQPRGQSRQLEKSLIAV